MLFWGEGKQIRALRIHSGDGRNGTEQQLFAEDAPLSFIYINTVE